jgi:phosphoribosylamine--glycine ligase
MIAVVENRLEEQIIEWSDGIVVCVGMASGGYPGSYEKGKRISGLKDVDREILVFHCGTRSKDSGIVTDGGRVLCVTAQGNTHEEARQKAYKNVARISFEAAQYRKDIGLLNRR